MKTRIIIKINSQLLRKVQLIATQEAITVDALIERELNALVKKRTSSFMNKPISYDEARRHALALLRKGTKRGWKRPASRDELYQR